MSTTSTRTSTPLRVVGIICVLLLFLVVQFAVLYLFVLLSRSATWGNTSGYVPWLVPGGFAVVLVVLAAAVWRREQPAGMVLSCGLIVVALAPFIPPVGWCEVAGTSESLTPGVRIVAHGVSVGVMTDPPRCAAYLNGIVLVAGYQFMAYGLWMAAMTDSAIERIFGTAGV